MSGKNTAVFGLYPDEAEVAEGIEQLKVNGFRTTDLSILLPENLGSKDIGHEKHTKAPEGAVAGGIAGVIIGGVLAWLGSAGIIAIPAPGLDRLYAADLGIAVLAGAGACSILGAIIGALIGGLTPEYEAKRYEGRTRHSGVLLSVHCDNSDWRVRAKEALRHTGAEGIASVVESKADFGSSEKPKSRVQWNVVPRHKTFLRSEPQDRFTDQPAEPRVMSIEDTEHHPLG